VCQAGRFDEQLGIGAGPGARRQKAPQVVVGVRVVVGHRHAIEHGSTVSCWLLVVSRFDLQRSTNN